MGDTIMDESMDTEDVSLYFKPSYILVAIDTHSSMFETNGAPSPFKNCLKALYQLCDALLLKSGKRGWSPFSVVLYDKAEKASLVNFKDNMIEINKLLKEKSSLSEQELKKSFMRDYDLDLAAFFQLCKKKFKDVGSTFYRRIMLFVTDDHDPVNGDANKRFTALNEAKNFEENDITFQLIVSKEDFNFSVFFDELFSLLKSKVQSICEDEEGIYDKLISTIWFRHMQNKVRFFPFADDPTKFITAFKKSYIRPQRLLNNDHVAVDGTVLTRIAKKPDNGEMPESSKEFVLRNRNNRKKFMEIKFDLGEKLDATLRECPLGYTLLYVCHRLTGLGEVISEPRILEADTNEELPYFEQFWQHCVNNDKVLICSKMTKKGDTPRAVELIPKLIHGNKVFLIKAIPFANEIFEPRRGLKVKVPPPSEEQEKVMDDLIDRLTFDFSSSLLVDEKFVRKEKYLKAKLLDEDREDIKIRQFSTREEIDEKIEDIVDAYLESFPPEVQSGVKRKRAPSKKSGK
ncbi:hypothetical protein HHI36_003627 [Cryptolaemus montrouzieri]|uniref:Ku70/Ku80 N-terminal alpha/beta domain-containing protein n=1 Tax=Cryptolaemus montrouzieri TaxID=559131 RepID=A0ABD2PDZ8_9CUCU